MKVVTKGKGNKIRNYFFLPICKASNSIILNNIIPWMDFSTALFSWLPIKTLIERLKMNYFPTVLIFKFFITQFDFIHYPISLFLAYLK